MLLVAPMRDERGSLRKERGIDTCTMRVLTLCYLDRQQPRSNRNSAAANGVNSKVPVSSTTTAAINAQHTVSDVTAAASTTTPASGVIDLTNGAIVSTTTNPTSGDAVRIKQSVERPVNGWGNVKPGEVGVVIMIDVDTVIVDFPR